MPRSLVFSSIAIAVCVTGAAAIGPAEARMVRVNDVDAPLYCVAAEPGPYFFPAPDWGPFFRRVKHYGPVYRYCGPASDRRTVVSVKY